MNVNKLKPITLCAILLVAFSIQAQRVAGGSPKPAVAFGHENLQAISKDENIQKILAKSFGTHSIQLEKLELTEQGKKGFSYRLETSSDNNLQCVLVVTVWNSHQALVDEVKVTDINTVSGCDLKYVGPLKPLAAITAITNSSALASVLNLNFSIEKMELKKVSEEGQLYILDSNTFRGDSLCEIELLLKEGTVISVKNLAGDNPCKIIDSSKIVSVLIMYDEVFKSFPQSRLDMADSYESYLKVARSLSPELRKQIREYMKTSEPKYYQVLTKNKEQLKSFFAKDSGKKELKVGEVLWILYKIMGIPTNSEGIYMPAIVALKFVPFFVIE